MNRVDFETHLCSFKCQMMLDIVQRSQWKEGFLSIDSRISFYKSSGMHYALTKKIIFRFDAF